VITVWVHGHAVFFGGGGGGLGVKCTWN